jgi:hypothetical protein
MRYFCYNELTDDESNLVVTVSEDEIRQTYYPYWQTQMTRVGRNLDDYTFEDCLEDWMIVNGAWIADDNK